MEEGPRIGRGQFSIKGSYSVVPASPVKVGSERQLLMDDRVVDDWWDCRRTVHQPEKCPDHLVNWTGQENLDAHKGEAVRVHFWLRDAELYSFWFE